MAAPLALWPVAGTGISVGVKPRYEGAAGEDDLMRLLEAAMLEAAQRVLVPELKRTLSVENPPRSEPFTPPHRQTDEEHSPPSAAVFVPHLQDSIRAWMHDEGGVAVGSDGCIYALFLEIGTQHMAPRPWLAPTLERPDVKAAFAAAVASALARMASGNGLSNQPPAGGAA